MATLTASTPSPSAAQQKAAASPGIWKSVPPPSPPPTAVERIMTAKSYVANMFALSNKHDDKYFSLGTLFTIKRPYFLSCMHVLCEHFNWISPQISRSYYKSKHHTSFKAKMPFICFPWISVLWSCCQSGYMNCYVGQCVTRPCGVNRCGLHPPHTQADSSSCLSACRKVTCEITHWLLNYFLTTCLHTGYLFSLFFFLQF